MQLSSLTPQNIRSLAPALLLVATWALCSSPKAKAETSSLQLAACPDEPGELPIEEVRHEDYPEMGCVSVQNGADAFSTCARKVLKIARGSNNTSDAVAKLRSCLSSNGNATMLIGHGNAGSIRTGGGASVPFPNQIIGGNGDWQDALRDLNRLAKKITLFSCHTGAEASGRAFVDKLHAVTSATISAQNSMVFCSTDRKSLYLHTRKVWTVSPGGPTTPTGTLVPDELAYSCLRLVNENGQGCQSPIPKPFFSRVELTAIETPLVHASAIDLQHLSGPLSSKKNLKESLSFTAQLVEQIIGFCQPVKVVADARPYGSLVLTINGKIKRFNILDTGSLLQDNDHPQVLYLMDEAKFQILETALRDQLQVLLR